MNDYTIISVTRALSVLKLFLPLNQPMTLKEISEKSNLNKSTALRMAETLLDEKFLSYDQETKKYQLGYNSLIIGLCKLSSIDLLNVSRPILEELAERTGFFIHLAILEDQNAVVVGKIIPSYKMGSTTQLISRIGGILPLYCTGIGLLFMSQKSDSSCREYLERHSLKKYTTTTVTDVESIIQRIRVARDKGYTVNDGEHDEGIVSVCTPIYDYTNKIIAGMSLGGIRELVARENRSELVSMTLSAANEISRRLGWTGQSVETGETEL